MSQAYFFYTKKHQDINKFYDAITNDPSFRDILAMPVLEMPAKTGFRGLFGGIDKSKPPLIDKSKPPIIEQTDTGLKITLRETNQKQAIEELCNKLAEKNIAIENIDCVTEDTALLDVFNDIKKNSLNKSHENTPISPPAPAPQSPRVNRSESLSSINTNNSASSVETIATTTNSASSSNSSVSSLRSRFEQKEKPPIPAQTSSNKMVKERLEAAQAAKPKPLESNDNKIQPKAAPDPNQKSEEGAALTFAQLRAMAKQTIAATAGGPKTMPPTKRESPKPPKTESPEIIANQEQGTISPVTFMMWPDATDSERSKFINNFVSQFNSEVKEGVLEISNDTSASAFYDALIAFKGRINYLFPDKTVLVDVSKLEYESADKNPSTNPLIRNFEEAIKCVVKDLPRPKAGGVVEKERRAEETVKTSVVKLKQEGGVKPDLLQELKEKMAKISKNNEGDGSSYSPQ